MVILSPAEEQANWSFGAKVSKWGMNVEHPDSYREGISGALMGHKMSHAFIENQTLSIFHAPFFFLENGALVQEEF